jgi:hypothetical protein
MLVIRDDDVVHHFDVEDLSALDQFLCDQNVLRRRIKASRRMVVSQCNAAGI